MAGPEGQQPAGTVTPAFVLSWAWTALAAAAGLYFLFQPGLALAGITLLLSALAACPLSATLLEKQAGARLSGGLRLALAVIFAGLAGLNVMQNPAALRIPATAKAPPPATVLLEAYGQFGNQKTKAFTPPGKDWDLEWSFDCSGLGDSGIFNAKVMRQGGGVSANAEVNKINASDSGTEHYHEGGALYLDITSECKWNVKVSG